MYIRQQCMFSFEEILKYQPETRLHKIFSVLGKVNIVSLLPDKSRFGRKGYNREAMFYAIVAMYIENNKTVSALVARLRSNPVFRYTCGFDVIGKVPSESTFSRFLAKLSETGAIQKVFETLVVKAKELNIIDGTNIAIDSTKYEAYDTPLPKSKIIDDDPRLFTFPHRCTQKWKDLYNMRTAVERCFSRLKEYLGLLF